MNDNNSTLNDHSRQPIEWVILLLAATIVLRAWFLEGFPWGCQVVGGSMAETLLGTHREVICADCGHSFICDAALDSAACRAVCPNCGYAGNRLDASGDLAGDRVLIDRGAFLLRPPRRWEVVALRQPGQPVATCVKRVVGLPGETIQIRHGDVYADGRIQRKTLAQQRAMAVLVHDAKHLPTLEPLPARWQAESPHTAWDTAGGRFTHAATPDEKPVDWLMYHHGRRSADSPGEFCAGAGERHLRLQSGPAASRGRRPCGGRPAALLAPGQDGRRRLALPLGQRRPGGISRRRSIPSGSGTKYCEMANRCRTGPGGCLLHQRGY